MVGTGKEIYQFMYFEAYTPASGQITSADLDDKKLKYASIYLTSDADVTFKTLGGSSEATVPLPGKTFIPGLFTEISAVSTGSVYLCHNGVLLNPGE